MCEWFTEAKVGAEEHRFEGPVPTGLVFGASKNREDSHYTAAISIRIHVHQD